MRHIDGFFGSRHALRHALAHGGHPGAMPGHGFGFGPAHGLRQMMDDRGSGPRDPGDPGGGMTGPWVPGPGPGPGGRGHGHPGWGGPSPFGLHAWMRGGGRGPGRGGWGGQFGPGQRAKKGDVRAAILSLLAEGPRNGYQIIQEINERSGGAWKPSPGAVYPALQQLADEGLVFSEESGGGRKTFRLTEAGSAYVEAHPDELAAPWASMSADFGDDVRTVFEEAAKMGAALMQVVRTGTSEQIAEAGRLLAGTRRRLYLILAGDEPEPESEQEGEQAHATGDLDAETETETGGGDAGGEGGPVSPR